MQQHNRASYSGFNKVRNRTRLDTLVFIRSATEQGWILWFYKGQAQNKSRYSGSTKVSHRTRLGTLVLQMSATEQGWILWFYKG